MKIEFTSEEVHEILLTEARKYDPKLNTVRGSNWGSVPGVVVSFEAAEKSPVNNIDIVEIAA